jgi:cytochrome c oxidase assembly factor 2
MTTSLFTTTLMVSFLVVAAPHLIPCPVDPRTLTDSVDPVTGEIRRRRRRKLSEEETSDDVTYEERRRKSHIKEKLVPKRECPVPKPGGLIGQVFGLKTEEQEDDDTNPITSSVEKARRRGKSDDNQ